jgi:hypothetical protein
LFAEAFGNGFAASHKMFCFALKEAGGPNDLFEFRETGRC